MVAQEELSSANDSEVIVTTWTSPIDDPTRRSGLWRLRLDSTGGTAEPISTTPDAVYWATPEPGRNSLLLLQNDRSDPGMFRLAKIQGQYRLSEQWSTGGVGPSYLAFHPKERHFVVSNFAAGWTVFENGETPTAIASFSGSGSGPHPRQSQSHPHSGVFSADGTTIYCADMGSDEVLAVPFDASQGAIGATRVAYRTAPGSGPRQVVHGGDVLYLLNELGSTLEVLRVEEDGELSLLQTTSTLPPDYVGPAEASHLTVAADGLRVYAANRQHDSIAVFDVIADGRLEPRGWIPTGRWPWHFEFVTPSRMLVAANQSDEVRIYDMDADGWFAETACVTVPRPVFIAPAIQRDEREAGPRPETA